MSDQESKTIEADCWEHAETIAEEWARESVDSGAEEMEESNEI